MSAASDELYTFRLPRCTTLGCPVRYRGGPDRPCATHQLDAADMAAVADALALMEAPDGTSTRAKPVVPERHSVPAASHRTSRSREAR